MWGSTSGGTKPVQHLPFLYALPLIEERCLLVERAPPGVDDEYVADHDAAATAGQGYDPDLEYTYVDLATFETEF